MRMLAKDPALRPVGARRSPRRSRAARATRRSAPRRRRRSRAATPSAARRSVATLRARPTGGRGGPRPYHGYRRASRASARRASSRTSSPSWRRRRAAARRARPLLGAAGRHRSVPADPRGPRRPAPAADGGARRHADEGVAPTWYVQVAPRPPSDSVRRAAAPRGAGGRRRSG